MLIFGNEFTQTVWELIHVDEIVYRKYNNRFVDIDTNFYYFRLFRLLTCCITQYLVSICGRTAHVTVSLLRILQGPTLTCNHTRTKIAKLKLINSKGYNKFSKFSCNWWLIKYLLTCSTHKLVVMIWFFKFWKKRIFYC